MLIRSVSLLSVSSRLLVIVSAIDPSSSPVVEEVTFSVGASATASTCTSIVVLVEAERVVTVVSPLVGFVSLAVAVTVNWNSASLCAGGVIVRPANWAGVSVHEPPPLSVPALSVAPAGTPLIAIDSVSELSESTRLLVIVKAIELSSSPVVDEVTFSVGASATASTCTSIVALVEADSVVTVVSPLVGFVSLAVAVTVSWNSPSLCAGGVMVRPAS